MGGLSRPRGAARMALTLTVVGLMALSTMVSATAETVPATSPTASVPLECHDDEPHRVGPGGRFQHDGASVSAATKERVEREVRAQTAAMNARSARTGADPLPEEIRVPVRIHIIRGTHRTDRRVTHRDARRLYYQLQAGFAGRQDPTMAPTGIRFDLRAITVTRNDRWFHAAPGSKADRQMHRTLHRGSRSTLNIYLNSVKSPGGVLLGIARFPWLAGGYPKLDGVTVNVATLTGGRARGYNLGDTAIHEVGHWFGLFHTFEGGCEEPGDYVSDTAAEAQPSFRCSVGRDSCPSERPEGWIEGDPEPEPVLDPVRNFMDYSFDSCMNHFTPGQRTRAVTLFMRYRFGR